MTIISDKMVNVLPFVLRHCPKLHEFSIKLQANKGLNIVLHPLSTPPELHFLSTVPYGDIPLPQIQALRINSDNNKSLYKIIRSWPDIKHLVVTGEALVEFCLTPRNSNAEEVFNKLHLYEFQTGRVTMRSGKPTAATLRASLNSSIGTLQILDLKGISDGIIGRSGPLFVEHGPHLRSLRLPYISPEIGRDLVFLRHCVSLEEIVVYAYPTKTLWDKLVVGTIRHASFGAFTEPKSSMQAALRWLRTFPSLRVLSWPMGVGSSFPKDDIAKVERFCKEKGVYFRVLSMLEIEVKIFPIPSNHSHSSLVGRAHRTHFVPERRVDYSPLALSRNNDTIFKEGETIS